MSSALTVVGVGASAGGLEAFSQILRACSEAKHVAIVFVQHLSPHHESALVSLLTVQTPLTVVQAEEGMRVEAGHVYVIPPNVQMAMRGAELHLSPRPADRSRHTPIDAFLVSLAEAAQERSVAVILSGTASDGAIGLADVKRAGGLTFAQSPESAKYDGMPRAAIDTGMVDLVLPPAAIGAKLAELGAARLACRRRRSPTITMWRPTTCSGSTTCSGRSAASTSGTTSCRRSSGGCSGGWRCTGSATSATTSSCSRATPAKRAASTRTC